MAGGIARGHVRLDRFASRDKNASEEELVLVAAGAMRLPEFALPASSGFDKDALELRAHGFSSNLVQVCRL